MPFSNFSLAVLKLMVVFKILFALYCQELLQNKK